MSRTVYTSGNERQTAEIKVLLESYNIPVKIVVLPPASPYGDTGGQVIVDIIVPDEFEEKAKSLISESKGKDMPQKIKEIDEDEANRERKLFILEKEFINIINERHRLTYNKLS